MKKILLLAAGLAMMGTPLWLERNAPSQSTDPVLIGAGDIADGFNLNLANSLATATLLDQYPSATVYADGDLAYNNGSDDDFTQSYDPTWGRARARTIPVVGNHEYNTLNAAGFFSYFGLAAGDPTKGYYSLNLGTWHIIVLNSECGSIAGGCSSGSPEETWLKNDLAADTSLCTLALWHEPYYTSSSVISPATAMQPIWQDLYNANVELVVNGHAHSYERFAPQDANGNLDTARGIVEIVAGTGGEALFGFNSSLAANSLVQNASTFGILVLTLHSSSFDFQFVPQAGQVFTDSGTQACH